MRHPLDFSVPKESLFIPALAGPYEKLAQPLGWLLLRLALGGWLLHEGWPKILNPMGQVQFVEMIGFHPGWLFSPLLAITKATRSGLIAPLKLPTCLNPPLSLPT